MNLPYGHLFVHAPLKRNSLINLVLFGFLVRQAYADTNSADETLPVFYVIQLSMISIVVSFRFGQNEFNIQNYVRFIIKSDNKTESV